MRAYALMQQSHRLDADYTTSPMYRRAREQLEAIRAVLPSVKPFSYRGVGRYPFTEYAERGPGWQGEGGALKPDPEPKARSLFLEFLGPEDYQTPYPRAFLRQLEQIEAVQAVLSCKERYEVVEICSPPEYPRDPLGFDVGYWGGGNFSILCDATVWPLWHAPPEDALSELARAVTALNKHVLFPTELAASEYLSWY